MMIDDPALKQLLGLPGLPTGAETGDATARAPVPGGDAAQRVFDHWVFMLARHPQRTALGPKRRAVIERALELYPEDTLLMAVEGCAASAWHAGANDRRKCYQDIELILRDEAHIERFADDGAKVRELVERQAAREAQQALERAALTPEVVADARAAAEAAREAMRATAAKLRSRGA